jgi:hypothetical protein
MLMYYVYAVHLDREAVKYLRLHETVPSSLATYAILARPK